MPIDWFALWLVGRLLSPTRAQLKEAERRVEEAKRDATRARMLDDKRHAELIAAMTASALPAQPIAPPTPLPVQTKTRVPTPNPFKLPIPDDEFTQVVKGRAVKWALPELQELIERNGMVEQFKKFGYREEKGIWRHPAGIYLVDLNAASPKVFNTVAGARRFRDTLPRANRK